MTDLQKGSNLPNSLARTLSEVHAAADLGMFSMFGRTGAPTKGAANFCMPEIMDDPPSERE